jgi:hypothetical protein
MEEAADRLAQSARFRDGRPLVRLERWTSNTEELSRGIVRQRPIRGPSAGDLESATNLVEYLSSLPSLPAEKAELLRTSQQTLRDAGLTVAEARERIGALEQFYRKTHNTALEFQYENHLSGVGNSARDQGGRNVGLDYNHGQNVHWDPATHQFVMIDW